MNRYAFKMQLFPGQVAEYKKRHDELWPELAELLSNYGISDYSIFLDESSHALFATFLADERFDGECLKQEPVMQRWWQFMAPLMRTHEGSNEPVSTPLQSMFYLT